MTPSLLSAARSMTQRAARRIDRARKRFYLVSPAGVPNFGDEFIARSWLDWLAARHPHADVWLDCIERVARRTFSRILTLAYA